MSVTIRRCRLVALGSVFLLAGACGGESADPESADPSAAASPDTDIYLAELEGSGASLVVGAFRNVTDRVGYDNQPHFTPDGDALLYTAADDAGRTDILRYDLASERAELLTQTYPESEYSPTPLPGGDGFSVIRVEADSTQRLWRFGWDGSGPELVLPDVVPAGYHAWAGPSTLLVFVLGDPPTLQIATPGEGPGRTVATGVGRSLHPIPGSDRISYVLVSDTVSHIMAYDPASDASEQVAPTQGEGQDHAWVPDGTLLMAGGGLLYRWDGEGSEWAAVPMEEAFDGEISRLAVSPDGDVLAFVGAR